MTPFRFNLLHLKCIYQGYSSDTHYLLIIIHFLPQLCWLGCWVFCPPLMLIWSLNSRRWSPSTKERSNKLKHLFNMYNHTSFCPCSMLIISYHNIGIICEKLIIKMYLIYLYYGEHKKTIEKLCLLTWKRSLFAIRMISVTQATTLRQKASVRALFPINQLFLRRKDSDIEHPQPQGLKC